MFMQVIVGIILWIFKPLLELVKCRGKERKQKQIKLKGVKGFHVSPVQTSEIILKPLPIAYVIPHPNKHTLYLHTGSTLGTLLT